MKISKTVFTFTVLHESDNCPSSLEDALAESEDGAMVGQMTHRATTPLAADNVHEELVALGNDGEFFEDRDD